IGLLAYDAAGARERLELVVELTGRSANAYLVDAGSTVVATLRPRPDDVALPTAFRASRRAPPSEYGPTLRAELEARTALEGADAAAASLERDLAAPGSPRLYEFSSPKGIAYRLSTFPLVSAGDAPVELFAD